MPKSELQQWRDKFSRQKSAAHRRSVLWDMTFGEWYDWWISTGHMHERGRKPHEYCMARYNDTGPYRLDNIYCSLSSDNALLAAKRPRPRSAEHTRKIIESRQRNNKPLPPRSPEHRKALSEALTSYCAANPRVGRKHTPEQRLAQSIKKKAWWDARPQ